MIKIENTRVDGFQEAIRGCRNSWDSHEKSDSRPEYDMKDGVRVYTGLGENDHKLLMRLIKGGDSHAKCMRMVTVWFDLTAPMYFWKHFDQYHHVVRCSESVMHTITAKDLEIDDFSYSDTRSKSILYRIIGQLNEWVKDHKTSTSREEKKLFWRCIIETLPQSYMQKSTICTNYQTLRNMYHQRKGHKLQEWAEFREWIESLPYSELITGERRMKALDENKKQMTVWDLYQWSKRHNALKCPIYFYTTPYESTDMPVYNARIEYFDETGKHDDPDLTAGVVLSFNELEEEQ